LLQDAPLVQVETTRFLGVCIDRHLTWKAHINEISIKIAKNIGILSRIARLLPQSVKLSLYYTLVYPYLNYCNMIWAITYPTKLKGLIILQKRVVRLIAGARRREHTAPLLREFKMLRIDQIKDLQAGEFFYRLEHGLLPPSFKDFLLHTYDIHSHYTRNASSYRSIKVRTNARLHTIKSQGTQIWNSFPSEIRTSNSLFTFKKRLRAHLLSLI